MTCRGAFDSEHVRRATKGGSPAVASAPGMVTVAWHGIMWVLTPGGARRLASQLQQAAIDAGEKSSNESSNGDPKSFVSGAEGGT
jgi:hypothetical protein